MASITLDGIAADNTINLVEATKTLPLSGTSSDIPPGTLVSIFIDGSPTAAAYSFLNADGSWHAVLDASELADGPHTITASAASASSIQNVTVDTVAPEMTVTRSDAALTNDGTVHYSVVFTEAPVSVTIANFGLAVTGTIAGATVTGVTPIDATHYTVTVATGTGDGTIALTATGLKDAAGNGIAGVTFQPVQTIPTATGDIYALRSGDLNSDGRPDLVGVGSQGFGIWLNNGDGTFAFENTNIINLSSSALVDVNNDGKLDLVAGRSSAATVYIFLGNGDGTFGDGPSAAFSSTASPVGLAAADFNGDGKVDLAVNSATSPPSGTAFLTVYLGAGNGSARARATTSWSATTATTRSGAKTATT